MSEAFDETRKSVQRMQEFNPEALPRQDELGQGLSFSAAVVPANKLIGLYKQLSLSALDDMPDQLLKQIHDRANADFNLFQQIMDFDLNRDNPAAVRDSYVQAIIKTYPATFTTLHPLISYGVSKSVDFQRMETEARAKIQSITDHANDITKQLEKNREQANAVLKDVRRAAAEQGVSQQAIYFKDEAKDHNDAANSWRTATIWMAIALGLYSVFTLFLHKIPFFVPADSFQSFQLVASKVLIFAVLSYMLFLTAKNFLSHKHNAIVNKHRQNALMTFEALVEASGTDDGKEVILTHASACIFAPQDTGYVKPGADSGSAKSIVELLPKAMIKVNG